MFGLEGPELWGLFVSKVEKSTYFLLDASVVFPLGHNGTPRFSWYGMGLSEAFIHAADRNRDAIVMDDKIMGIAPGRYQAGYYSEDVGSGLDELRVQTMTCESYGDLPSMGRYHQLCFMRCSVGQIVTRSEHSAAEGLRQYF